MTEKEWLECTDPTPMLEFIRGKVSDRKLRLFACACCRRIWQYLPEKRSRWIVEICERYADRQATRERLERAWEQADLTFDRVHMGGGGDVEQNPAQAVVGLGIDLNVGDVIEMAAATFGAVARGGAYDQIWKTPGRDNNARWAEDDAIRTAATTAEGQVQSFLLRCSFANPFRPVTIDPRWLTADVTDLARAIYEDKAFDRMPIFADALMDAGCDSEEIIAHCRGDGPHVRGCWVVDLLLGKQ